MKTRQGFVSNSSSSSFIVIGTKFTPALEAQLKAKLPNPPEDDEWLYDNTISDLTDGLSIMYVGDNERIIGDVLADVGSDGDHLERQDYTIAQLVEKIERVQDVVGDLVDVKLMMGTRPS
jgi:hypothetical protein